MDAKTLTLADPGAGQPPFTFYCEADNSHVGHRPSHILEEYSEGLPD